ncbi:MAG TPA: AzlD domain-containing protein [Burkholderiaceae bacterium]|nr:AzlD domain-containing protein [Burkholderiaceae bacterium]
MNFDIDWYVFGAILLLTLCSILTRSSYLLFGHRFPLSDGLRRAFRYAPVAALAGIVVPELVPWQPGVALSLDARPLAAIAAIILFLRTGSTLAVIIGGMVAFWVFRFLLSVGI